MKFDKAFFDKGIDRHNTGSEKWDDLQACPEGALAMWVADMDFEGVPAITKAIQDRAQHPCYGYCSDDVRGAKAFCDYWQRRHHLTITPVQTVRMPCVITGLRCAVQALTQPGDEVVLLTPVYPPFYSVVKDSQRVIKDCPLLQQEDGRFNMDYDAIEQAFKGGAKMMILCNPHNPLSRVWTKAELEKLLALAIQYHVIIASDEIHADFVYKPNTFVPMLSLENAKDHVVAMASASKTFNVAGLQQAQCVCYNPEMLKAIARRMGANGVNSGNVFALVGTCAAYEEGDDWLDGLLDYLDEGRKVLAECVEEMVPKARLVPVEATYLAWLDLRAYGLTCAELDKKCKEQGVVFNPGTIFGNAGEGFIRVNFGCPHANIKEAIVRLSKALGEKE